MEPQKRTIKWELSPEEADVVMRALGKLPYDDVAGLIMKLWNQGQGENAQVLMEHRESK